VAPDLIDGYLAELAAGLRIPAAEAELILAEAEDHLRETAAAGLETGMTKVQAQQDGVGGWPQRGRDDRPPGAAGLPAPRHRLHLAADVPEPCCPT
jgi:hypothetical protein